MAYIGRKPQIGNFQICDAISTVNAQAAYTMQVGSVNVLPETANHMIVSLNGVIQAPISSYTVSGSTITFAANLVTGDVINFIQILGDVLDLGVPSDGTVTSGKIANDAVTLAKMASGTDGNIISYDTSGNPVAVATGNDGQVLTSAGAGAVPAFETLPSGGAYVKLETITLSGTVSTVEFNTNNFTSTYRDYKMIFSNVNITADGLIYMRIGEAGQATLEASNYRYASVGLEADNDTVSRAGQADTKFEITPVNLNASTRYNNNFEVTIYNPLDTGTYLAYSANGMINNQSNFATTMISAGQYGGDYAKQFKRFTFYFASGGDWAGTGGTITLLGRAN